LLLQTTDETCRSYRFDSGEYRCTGIKDRNGNFITINYDGYGHITTIIDTLARTITFNYDANHKLQSITALRSVLGQTQLQAHEHVGLHNHYFTASTSTLTINTGDTLFCYAYIDPGVAALAELMLQWSDGTTWYNAYWGSNLIAASDTNGSLIFNRDPLGHQKSLSYTDSFSDGINRNTFAYPTTSTDNVHAINVFDGAGRVQLSAHDAPVPGASGTRYSGQKLVYDVLGRVIAQSNPTEMSPGWVATGDDAAGWVSSFQTYDWKGRVKRTINADGTSTENTYAGCAGGEIG
jgi:YD repeat-containing protein